MESTLGTGAICVDCTSEPYVGSFGTFESLHDMTNWKMHQRDIWWGKEDEHTVIPWNGFIVECDELLTICYKNSYNTKSS